MATSPSVAKGTAVLLGVLPGKGERAVARRPCVVVDICSSCSLSTRSFCCLPARLLTGNSPDQSRFPSSVFVFYVCVRPCVRVYALSFLLWERISVLRSLLNNGNVLMIILYLLFGATKERIFSSFGSLVFHVSFAFVMQEYPLLVRLIVFVICILYCIFCDLAHLLIPDRYTLSIEKCHKDLSIYKRTLYSHTIANLIQF